jgi:hypothetical protein
MSRSQPAHVPEFDAIFRHPLHACYLCSFERLTELRSYSVPWPGGKTFVRNLFGVVFVCDGLDGRELLRAGQCF